MQRHSFVVFWLEDGVAMSKPFANEQMGDSMKFCEALRTRRSTGEQISHVCLSSEIEHSVGLPGVSDKLPENYDWTKQGRDGQPRRR